MRAICIGVLCLGSICFAEGPSLDSLMTKEDQAATGYSSLTSNQKQAFDHWIHRYFTLKTQEGDTSLSLSINVRNGEILILSDGSKWEVAPKDRVISGLWITPFPLILSSSDSKEYPKVLVNLQTQERVQVRSAS